MKISTICRTSLLGAVASVAALWGAAGQAQTVFDQDVGTAIDRGIEWLANTGRYNAYPNCNNGDIRARGLVLLAVLEKRQGNDPEAEIQGYSNASATDKERMRNAAACILDRVNEAGVYTYADGNWLMGLSLYVVSGGPDKGEHPDLPNDPDLVDIRTAMDTLSDRLMAAQTPQNYGTASYRGMWGYSGIGNDSSTTQFAVAGLSAAKAYYTAEGDPGGRLPAINTALANARKAYVDNASTAGSDNGSCDVVDEDEAGFGYRSTGYNPSLQQTASGTWVQLLGGATVNDPTVQSYLRWLRGHYRWQDLDNMGNSWAGSSWWYYLWSSFKAMEFIRASEINPAPGNLGPDAFGLLPPDADANPADALPGTCAVRQVHQDPDALPRVASFGAGGAGYYGEAEQSQYFDYAYQILSHQCFNGLPLDGSDGQFACNGAPSRWSDDSRQAYAILVLQRALGGVCNDSDGDGVCDGDDNCPATPNPDQADRDGDGVGDVCDNCPDVPNPDQEDSNDDGIGDACSVEKCDIDTDGDIDRLDTRLIAAARGQNVDPSDPMDADSNGTITIRDVKICTAQCTRARCATQ